MKRLLRALGSLLTVNIIHKGANYGYSQREGNELLQANNTTAPLPDVDRILVQLGDAATDVTVVRCSHSAIDSVACLWYSYSNTLVL